MKNSSLIFIICLALGFVVFQYFTWPQYNEYQLMNQKVKDLNANLEAIKKHETDTKDAYDKITNGSFKYQDSYGQEKEIKYADITIDGKKKNSVLEAALPDRAFVPALYNLYYTIAKSSGVELDSVDMPESSKKPRASTQPADKNSQPKPKTFEEQLYDMGITYQTADITIAGPYPRFRDFLRGIEQSARFVQIDSIEFSMPQQRSLAKDKNINIEDLFTFKVSTKVYNMNK
jgi:Tfp pilus assembly protein PilO